MSFKSLISFAISSASLCSLATLVLSSMVTSDLACWNTHSHQYTPMYTQTHLNTQTDTHVHTNMYRNTHNMCKGRSKLMSLNHSINFNKTQNVSHCHGQGRRKRLMERKGAGVSTLRSTASVLKSGLWANHQPLLAPSSELTSLPPLRDLPTTPPTSSSPSPLQPSIPPRWQPLTHTPLFNESISYQFWRTSTDQNVLCLIEVDVVIEAP